MNRVWRKVGPGLVALGLCCGCTVHLDKPTEVQAGAFRRSVYSVDGRVHVDAHAHAGKIRSVDGGVTLDDWASATAISAVDGPVELGRQAVCEHRIDLVDGYVRLGRGARVGGDVRTYSARVDANDAQIGGVIRTVSGRIELRGITHVAKGIELDRPKPSTDPGAAVWKTLPVVVIGPGVVVDGAIVAQRGGTLWVSRQARIGKVRGLRVRYFVGAWPPDMRGSSS